MNTTRIVILVLAIAAAGGAAFLVQGFVLNQEPEVVVAQAPEIEMTEVLVAGRDLAAGETVNGGVRWQRWPAEAVTPQFVTRDRQPDARNEFDGAIVRRQVAAGEPIIPSALVRSGAAGVMAALLSPGMRAVAVPVSDETGAGGFILPGDRVDVVLTRESGQDRFSTNFESATIMTNVRVLAVDQTFDEEIEGGARVSDTATLEVLPGQAELLAMAMEAGTVSLALRSFADLGESTGALNDLSLNEIFSGEAPVAGDSSRVTILRNGQSNRMSMQRPVAPREGGVE